MLTGPRIALTVALSAVLGLTATLGLSVGTPSSAADRDSPDDVTKPFVVEASSDAETLSADEIDSIKRDLARLGNPSGLSLKDASEQQRFAREVGEYERRFPENFFASGVPTEGAHTYWIALKHEPSEAEFEALGVFPVDVEVRPGPAGSAADFENEVDRLSAALLREFSPQTGFSVFPAPDGSAIEVGFDSSLIDEERVRVIASRTARGAIPVKLMATGPVRLSLFAAMEGGRQLRDQNGAAHCTSGFAVDRNGHRGLVTAGHCPNNRRYKNAIASLNTAPGDSGGPVFFGNSARGTVTGLGSIGGTLYDLITRIGRVHNSLGPTVRTTTP